MDFPSDHCECRFYLGVHANSSSPHSSSVQALQEHEGFLYSASRDSTIKKWSFQSSMYTCDDTFIGHTSWVTDLALMSSSERVISSSSDRTIKVWSTDSGHCISSVRHHRDYVQSLALSEKAGIFASAGLDNQLYIWKTDSVKEPVHSLVKEHDERCGSFYCVAIDEQASILVSGSTDELIRAWDPRTGRLCSRLTGHTGNIRSVLLSNDGTKCLSASCDNTVRLWDLRQQSCINIFYPLDDSVWDLASNSSFSNVFAAGKAGIVSRIDTLSDTSTLVASIGNLQVTNLTLSSHEERLWVCSSDGSVNCLDVSGLMRQSDVKDPPKPLNESSEKRRISVEIGQVCCCPPCEIDLCRSLPNAPALVRAEPLNDGRRVVVQDFIGNVDIWDVVEQTRVQQLGIVEFENVLKEYFVECSLPGWFTIDLHLGSLGIVLKRSSAFSATVWTQKNPPSAKAFLGLDKENLGALALKHLFFKWSSLDTSTQNLKKDAMDEDNSEELIMRPSYSPRSPMKKNGPHWFGFDNTPLENTPNGIDLENHEDLSLSPMPIALNPAHRKPSEETAISVLVIADQVVDEAGVTIPRILNLYSPSEISSILAKWIQSFVKEGIFPDVRVVQSRFDLIPHPSDDLQELPTGKHIRSEDSINMRTISHYVIENLQDEAGDFKNKRALYPNEPEKLICIICNNKILPPEMTVRTARTFEYRDKSSGLALYYARTSAFQEYVEAHAR